MKIRVLGCGGSFGSPLAWGKNGNIDTKNPYNYRTRSSVLLTNNNQNILLYSYLYFFSFKTNLPFLIGAFFNIIVFCCIGCSVWLIVASTLADPSGNPVTIFS